MLDFVWLEDRRGDVVAQLSDTDLSELNEALVLLEAKTGVWLDPYSNTRIAPDHAKILVDAIRSKPHKRPNIEQLAGRLDESVALDKWLLAIGD